MTTVLSIDLGEKVGWAISSPEGTFSGVESFELAEGEGDGLRFLRFIRWLDRLKNFKVEEVYFTEKIIIGNVEILYLYAGLRSHIQAWCEVHKTKYDTVIDDVVFKVFLGRKKYSMDNMIKAAKQHGFNTENEVEIKALSIAYYVISKLKS